MASSSYFNPPAATTTPNPLGQYASSPTFAPSIVTPKAPTISTGMTNYSTQKPMVAALKAPTVTTVAPVKTAPLGAPVATPAQFANDATSATGLNSQGLIAQEMGSLAGLSGSPQFGAISAALTGAPTPTPIAPPNPMTAPVAPTGAVSAALTGNPISQPTPTLSKSNTVASYTDSNGEYHAEQILGPDGIYVDNPLDQQKHDDAEANAAAEANLDSEMQQQNRTAGADQVAEEARLAHEGLQPGASSYADQQLEKYMTDESIAQNNLYTTGEKDKIAAQDATDTERDKTAAQEQANQNTADKDAALAQLQAAQAAAIPAKTMIAQMLADGTITVDQAKAHGYDATAGLTVAKTAVEPTVGVKNTADANLATANAASATALTAPRVALTTSQANLNNQKATQIQTLTGPEAQKLMAQIGAIKAGKGGVYSSSSLLNVLNIASQLPALSNLTAAQKSAAFKELSALPPAQQAKEIAAIQKNVATQAGAIAGARTYAQPPTTSVTQTPAASGAIDLSQYGG